MQPGMSDDLDNPIEESTPEPKGGGKSFTTILLVACLIGGGVGGFLFWRHSARAKAKPEPQNQVKEVLHLEDFVVNLADAEAHSYVRLGLDLGQTEAPKAGKEAGPNPVPAIRDTVLSVVSVYKSDELLTAEGKVKLKRELLGNLQQRVPEAHVAEVYFTEFLVQR
jgi:flagellar FliL protein